MARKPREEVADGIHHVYARGNNKQVIYRDDNDRQIYLALLRMTTAWAKWRCLAYCLMDNHLHLLVETPKPNLGAGMQRLHGSYGRRFNDRHGLSGHVFQGRFGSKRILGEEHFATTARYVVRNPVEAGFCREPGDWPWGSHGDVVRGSAPPWLDQPRLLSYFEPFGGDPWTRYRGFVEGK
jgi:putative transposase